MSDIIQKTKMEASGATLKIDTPQQDGDWSEERKIAWVKTATEKIIKAFTDKKESE